MPEGYDMFFTDNQIEILNVFFSQPDVELHMSALGDVLGKKPGVFQKGLNKLETEGMLKSRMRGNQRLFSLNGDYPFIDEVRSIVEKTAGVVRILISLFHQFDEVTCAFIFGSFVEHKMRPDSDIDLIVVCPTSMQGGILKEISVLEDKVLREINPKFYTAESFSQKRVAADPFLKEVLSRKVIMLKGSI